MAGNHPCPGDGLVHLMTAQAEYEEAAYMGYLFVGNFLRH